jgi:hypothetical protein
MSEDKKTLLQKVVDLKLKKSEVEKAIGLPLNSLSAMCSGKKELPDKYVEPLHQYLLSHGMIEIKKGPLVIEPGHFLYPKDGIQDREYIPPILAVIYDEKGIPIAENDLNTSIVPTSNKVFDCEKMPNNLFDEFPKYRTDDSIKVAKLDDALNALKNDRTPLQFKARYSFDPNVIESFLKSEGITLEQLIEGYKSWGNQMNGVAQAVKEQEKNPHIVTATNTPQGLTEKQLAIRKSKLGF